MKFYIIKEQTSIKTKYCNPYIPNDSPWSDEELFISKYKDKHDLPIIYNIDEKIAPNDFPFSMNFLVSERFFCIIKEINNDYESLESKIYYVGKNYNNSDKINWNYYTIILPEYNLFNYEKSDYKTYYNDEIEKKIITRIKKLVLDKGKINNLKFANNFFHLGEKKSYILCTEIAKQAIEEAGLIGIAFEEVPVE